VGFTIIVHSHTHHARSMQCIDRGMITYAPYHLSPQSRGPSVSTSRSRRPLSHPKHSLADSRVERIPWHHVWAIELFLGLIKRPLFDHFLGGLLVLLFRFLLCLTPEPLSAMTSSTKRNVLCETGFPQRFFNIPVSFLVLFKQPRPSLATEKAAEIASGMSV